MMLWRKGLTICIKDVELWYLLIRVWWLGETKRIALVGRQGYTGYVRPQIEEERVEASAQAHRWENAQAQPIDKEPGVPPDKLNGQLVGTVYFVN